MNRKVGHGLSGPTEERKPPDGLTFNSALGPMSGPLQTGADLEFASTSQTISSPMFEEFQVNGSSYDFPMDASPSVCFSGFPSHASD